MEKNMTILFRSSSRFNPADAVANDVNPVAAFDADSRDAVSLCQSAVFKSLHMNRADRFDLCWQTVDSNVSEIRRMLDNPGECVAIGDIFFAVRHFTLEGDECDCKMPEANENLYLLMEQNPDRFVSLHRSYVPDTVGFMVPVVTEESLKYIGFHKTPFIFKDGYFFCTGSNGEYAETPLTRIENPVYGFYAAYTAEGEKVLVDASGVITHSGYDRIHDISEFTITMKDGKYGFIHMPSGACCEPTFEDIVVPGIGEDDYLKVKKAGVWGYVDTDMKFHENIDEDDETTSFFCIND